MRNPNAANIGAYSKELNNVAIKKPSKSGDTKIKILNKNNNKWAIPSPSYPK